ncbi:cytochrome c [Paenibacillus sp. SI8]|uniref:c-type cytochrome n=1 Tax=unclassified Paenibacillus TaxID=185978 RepID=UPI00346522DD
MEKKDVTLSKDVRVRGIAMRPAAWRGSFGVMIGIALVLFLAACGGGSGSKASVTPAATMAPESDPAYVKAQELYTTNKCISCHGVDLAGKVGPKTNLQKVGSTMSKEAIANQIKNGGGGMLPYKNKLSDEEVELLSDWLSSKK